MTKNINQKEKIQKLREYFKLLFQLKLINRVVLRECFLILRTEAESQEMQLKTI